MAEKPRVLVGITGASGAAVAVDLVKRLPGDTWLVVSDWGRALLKDELDMKVEDLKPHVRGIFSDSDLAAPFASGTNLYDTMVIVPCSASTLGKIAAGIGDTLITRAAQVAMKERIRLVLALRETPLSSLMLENALKLSREGAVIAPLMPPFYERPSTLEALIGKMADKLLALAGAPAAPGWREDRLGS